MHLTHAPLPSKVANLSGKSPMDFLSALSLAIGVSLWAGPAQAETAVRTAPEPWAMQAKEIGLEDWRFLYAIALQESKMAFSDGSRPWPWTINSPITGPLRFKSKEEAVAKVREVLEQGVENIDIGLMQINLRWHAQRVNYDVGRLFDPSTNISVAAEILMENMEQVNGDYERAVALYHSRDPARGARYAAGVSAQLRKVKAVY